MKTSSTFLGKGQGPHTVGLNRDPAEAHSSIVPGHRPPPVTPKKPLDLPAPAALLRPKRPHRWRPTRVKAGRGLHAGGGVDLLELAEDQAEEARGGAHHEDAEDLPAVTDPCAFLQASLRPNSNCRVGDMTGGACACVAHCSVFSHCSYASSLLHPKKLPGLARKSF